jgi:hypothetical protein
MKIIAGGPTRRRGRKRPDVAVNSKTHLPDEYRVGPGRPPKEYQFKPGVSGNPKGARRRTPSIAPDLKALLERTLGKKMKLRHGEREEIVTKAAAGIDKLVSQFAKGDRYARRDLVALADKLGVDLTAGRGKEIESALAEVITADDEALLAGYLRRHGGGHDHSGDDSKIVRVRPSKDSPKPDPNNPQQKGS